VPAPEAAPADPAAPAASPGPVPPEVAPADPAAPAASLGPAAPAGPGPARGRAAAVTRGLAALLLVLLVVVARAGPESEPRNLAAVAVPYLLWPLLLAAAALTGPALWRAADPWWALASAERLAGTPVAPVPATPPPVWPAVVTGGAWAVFAGVYALSVPPRALATMLAGYTLALLAGALALGRPRWLGSADAVGLLVSWTGLLRRGGLTRWVPPAGAAALLGAVCGGALFARFRLSRGWVRFAVTDEPLLWHRGGAVAAVVAGAAAAYALDRWAARRGAAGSVAAALVPVVAATAVATVLRRALVAAQLLPPLVADPFARGWRLLGPLGEARAVDVNPWGTAVQQGLAAAVVTLGAVAGAWVLARRVRGVRQRDPAALAVYAVAFAGVLVATAQ
jgi:hypothetical protein